MAKCSVYVEKQFTLQVAAIKSQHSSAAYVLPGNWTNFSSKDVTMRNDALHRKSQLTFYSKVVNTRNYASIISHFTSHSNNLLI